MKKSKQTQPKADQPRVSTASLKRMDAPANLQYRVSGIKSMNARKPRKATRELGR